MNNLRWALFLSFFLLFTPGCGVYMAFTQPEQVDLTSLEAEGIPRDHVIDKLGVPKTSTRHPDGSRTEIYEFYAGSETGWKIGRGVFHLGADIVSLGLWEIIATPAEYAIKGDRITAKAEYDAQENMVAFTLIDREEKPLEEVEK